MNIDYKNKYLKYKKKYLVLKKSKLQESSFLKMKGGKNEIPASSIVSSIEELITGEKYNFYLSDNTTKTGTVRATTNASQNSNNATEDSVAIQDGDNFFSIPISRIVRITKHNEA
tara:strand:+ start:157 stop:501 length:345 start_codon:yes stop_codon:yes gene_type:complete